jgi:hypothetical protein
MTVKIVKGTVWFRNEKAYTGYPTEQYPTPVEYVGGIDPGRIMELVEAFTTYSGAEWVKFIVRNSEDVPATLYMPRYATDYGWNADTYIWTKVTLAKYPVTGDVTEVAVRILADGEIRRESDGSAAVKQIWKPGLYCQVDGGHARAST